MNYQHYTSSRMTPTYSSYNTTPSTNYFENNNSINRDQRYTDSYGRSIVSPLPAIFRTATITTNSPPPPRVTAKVQQFSYRPLTSTSTYDTPRSYNETMTSGYGSDTNDLRCSSISVRPMNGSSTTTTNIRHAVNQQPSIIKPSTGTEQNYYSDSEYVTSGPRYYKITRQVNTVRRPSNVVLPIRSIISKAYDQYVPPEPPKIQQQPFDVYRYQQEQQRIEREREREREQRERERQEQLQRQLYQQQQQQAAAAAARFNPLPKLTIPSQTTFEHEIGAELLKSPITHSKYYFLSNKELTVLYFQRNVLLIQVSFKLHIILIQQSKNKKKWHVK